MLFEGGSFGLEKGFVVMARVGLLLTTSGIRAVFSMAFIPC